MLVRALPGVLLLGAALVLLVVLRAFSSGSVSHADRSATQAISREMTKSPDGPAHRRLARLSSVQLEHALGETLITGFDGPAPSRALLASVRAGQVGGVILFSENLTAGTATARRSIDELQHTARIAGTWPLLIMVDQEGGEVRRLAGSPPHLAPREMSSAEIARREGRATGQALRAIGVNVDLAPVADVEQVAGSFLGARSFGTSPAEVAQRACAFASGLDEAGVAYTLKHFPGLGTAEADTDTSPVMIDTPRSRLRANYAAYRRCGHGARAMVMISSASYPTLTGDETPAVDSRVVYERELPDARVDAITISDDLEAAALSGREHPALSALRAGLDLLLYARSEQVSHEAFPKLAKAMREGRLAPGPVERAAAAIDRLKRAVAR